MNKGVTLGILGVIACAMGIILIQGLKSDVPNVEPTAERPAIESSATESPAAMNQETLPPAQEGGSVTGQQEETRPQTNQQPTTPASPVLPPEQPAPQLTSAPEKTVPAKSEATKPASAKPEETSTPQGQKADTASSSTQAEQPKKAESGTPALKPLESQPAQTTGSQQQASKTATGDAHTLSKIGLHFRGNDIYLRVEADSDFKEKVFLLSGPDRLVVDLAGKWKGVTAPSIPQNQLVTKARIGEQPNATRLVLDLSRSAKYTINKVSGSVLEITLR